MLCFIFSISQRFVDGRIITSVPSKKKQNVKLPLTVNHSQYKIYSRDFKRSDFLIRMLKITGTQTQVDLKKTGIVHDYQRLDNSTWN